MNKAFCGYFAGKKVRLWGGFRGPDKEAHIEISDVKEGASRKSVPVWEVVFETTEAAEMVFRDFYGLPVNEVLRRDHKKGFRKGMEAVRVMTKISAMPQPESRDLALSA